MVHKSCTISIIELDMKEGLKKLYKNFKREDVTPFLFKVIIEIPKGYIKILKEKMLHLFFLKLLLRFQKLVRQNMRLIKKLV